MKSEHEITFAEVGKRLFFGCFGVGEELFYRCLKVVLWLANRCAGVVFRVVGMIV